MFNTLRKYKRTYCIEWQSISKFVKPLKGTKIRNRGIVLTAPCPIILTNLFRF